MRLLILSLLCSFVYLLVLQTSCFAEKFTMFPMVGRSHYLVLARIGEELESRGHEVKYKCSWRSHFITTYEFSKFFGSISNLLHLVKWPTVVNSAPESTKNCRSAVPKPRSRPV